MLGYIVNFYKYATFPHTMKGDMADFLNQDVKGMRGDEDITDSLLVYGDFDRLNIKRVTDFTRFRDVDFYARRWLGQRQSILLYQLEKKIESDLLERIFGLEEQASTSMHRNFVVLTMVTLDPMLHRCEEYGEMLVQCNQLISQQLGQVEKLGLIEPKELEYQVYGSFSSSELVIVWWANQYSDVLQLADMLRSAKFKYGKNGKCQLLPFISFYSIIGQMRGGEGELAQPIVGSAELKLAFQDGILDESKRTQFLDELKERLSKINGIDVDKIKTNRNVGEYDYSISLPSNCICDPYKKNFYRNGLLHWDNAEIKKYISLTHVQLYYDKGIKEDASLSGETLHCSMLKESRVSTSEKNSIIKNIQLIGEMVYGASPKAQKVWDDKESNLENYRKFGLRNMIKHYFPETDGLCDTIDLLYSDYINNCSNLTSSAWASDLTTQFIEMVDYIADQIIRTFTIRSVGHIDSSVMFYDIKEISSVFIQMIYHIAQSRRTVFIVPSCHLRYMGQYDMILHAYYGVEKIFLNLAYSLQCNDLQPFLVPAFMIDVVPDISTKMYKIYHHYERDKKISGIFSINMPLGAMTDFLRYSMVVCHETAHFVTPYNRDKRNQVIGMLIYSEFMVKCVMRKILLASYEDTDETEAKAFYLVNDYLLKSMMPIIYNGMRNFYVQNIHEPVMEQEKISDERYPKWLDYREAIIMQIAELLEKKDILFNILKFLDMHKKDFIQTANDCLEELGNSWNGVGESLFPKDFVERILGLLATGTEINEPSLGDNILAKDMIKIFERRETFYRFSYVLSDAYREACQDLFMIRVFQIDLVDYLVFCDRHKNDTLTLTDQGTSTDRIRIAMICDYLLVSEYNEKCKDVIPTQAVLERLKELYESYCKLFTNIPEMRTSKIDPIESGKLDDKVEIAFQNTYDAYRDYLEDYSSFRSLFLQQMKDSDLVFRFYPKTVPTDDLYKFYMSWKEAVLNEDTKEMNAGVFSNNIAMIQHFLHQDTIRELANKSEGGT